MAGSRRLTLRRPDTCVVCGRSLAAGTTAFWDVEAKSVTCLDCLESLNLQSEDGAEDSVQSEAEPLERGKAGSSASRRYTRLHARREQQVRDRFGRLSGIYLALTDDPQSTVAWAQGGRGEELLGGYLEKLHDERTVIVLHDRRIPRTRANIDHVAITRSGAVWVIDAKNYTGKVQRLEKGGWFSSDVRLYVGRRDCTKLVSGMAKQLDAISSALGQPLMQEFGVQSRAALCFVNAEWSLFAKPFALEAVWVGWPKALGERLEAPGVLAPEHLLTLARRVADALPPA